MKSQYLIDLIRQHSRIIIPNFGAFLLKVKPESNSDTDLQISFNDFLKFNDGKLIDYVAKTEQIDKYEAEHQIKEYVSKIQYSLINDGKHFVEGLGTIYKDENGNLKFDRKEVEFIKPPQPVEPSVKTESKTGLTPFVKEEKAVKEENKPDKNEKPLFNIPKKEKPKPEIEKPKEKPEKKPPLKTNKKSETKITKPPMPTKPSKKKNKLLPIWRHISLILAVLIIVAIILYLAGFFDSTENLPQVEKNQITQTTNDEDNQPEQTIAKNETTVDKPEQSKSITQVEPDKPSREISESKTTKDLYADKQNKKAIAEKSTTQPASQNKSTSHKQQSAPVSQSSNENTDKPKYYHIVAGSFNNKGNAYNYVLKLRAQGFDSRIVNKRNGFYRVSLNSYTTKRKALSELKNIRQQHNPNAWYLYYRE
ncbi:MAG: SPOR domain-containing protein [Bacteroidota bacterium]|nr:SPOR domain-containing protein [Bacteroidota bacterium]